MFRPCPLIMSSQDEEFERLTGEYRTATAYYEGTVSELGRRTLCANMTETSCVTAISEGGKENQHGNDERFFPTRYRCGGSI